MSRSLHRKWPIDWKDLLSVQIFKLDVVDGFKYRRKQALFFLFATLSLLSLTGWEFSFDASISDGSSHQISLLALFYFPLLVGLIFCFRACLIYDFNRLKISENKRPINRKSAQAIWIFKISATLFSIYYTYWMWRL